MNKDEVISIIRQCLNGKKESFSQIVKFYQRQIYVICFHFLRTHQEAEDATMEIFIKIFNSLNSYDKNYKFSTWIYKITVNYLNDILRRKKRERKYLFSEFSNGVNQDERTSPESALLRKAEESKLKKALQSLSIQYQNALMLKYYHELSYQQISEIMDIPVNTVGSLLFRGKNELRDKLKEMGE